MRQFRLPLKDTSLSRVHFMVEINPPQCRLTDLDSTNGTKVNGRKISAADLVDGDLIEAGQTVLLFSMTDEEVPTNLVRETKASQSEAKTEGASGLPAPTVDSNTAATDSKGDRGTSGARDVPSASRPASHSGIARIAPRPSPLCIKRIFVAVAKLSDGDAEKRAADIRVKRLVHLVAVFIPIQDIRHHIIIRKLK